MASFDDWNLLDSMMDGMSQDDRLEFKFQPTNELDLFPRANEDCVGLSRVEDDDAPFGFDMVTNAFRIEVRTKFWRSLCFEDEEPLISFLDASDGW
eukprot:CAMPEP_0194026308 /NCGR_PEP_ID=MMETSP0009_2-20130614/634_1 /TAXON_ID=210454 /ORGANISM="Grammatophora oceanica, Strain CCMP 410" /LENGTH=95 /DNA_ID=CAMNT_0038664941 /DNA_START=227 /DNA_END=511 /DNA_ORIENTATION=+